MFIKNVTSNFQITKTSSVAQLASNQKKIDQKVKRPKLSLKGWSPIFVDCQSKKQPWQSQCFINTCIYIYKVYTKDLDIKTQIFQ